MFTHHNVNLIYGKPLLCVRYFSKHCVLIQYLEQPSEVGTVVILIFQMRKLQSKRLRNIPQAAHLLNSRVNICPGRAGPRDKDPYPDLPGNQNSLFRKSFLPSFHNFMYFFFKSEVKFLGVKNWHLLIIE